MDQRHTNTKIAKLIVSNINSRVCKNLTNVEINESLSSSNNVQNDSSYEPNTSRDDVFVEACNAYEAAENHNHSGTGVLIGYENGDGYRVWCTDTTTLEQEGDKRSKPNFR